MSYTTFRTILAATLLWAGCATGETDNSPSTSLPATRVISLIPAATDLLLEMGAADRLVARTSFDRAPALAGLPSVGGGLTPGLEALLSLRPDLVISWPDHDARSLTARLEALGVRVFRARIESVRDVAETTRELGQLLGMEARAAHVIARLEQELDAVRAKVSTLNQPSVLYIIALDPLTTVGPGGFLHEIIEIAGGRNSFGDASSAWPRVNFEEVLLRQPDLIVLADASARNTSAAASRLRYAAGWRELRAVQQGRVVQIDPDLFNRPGPHLGRAARELAALLHPNAFPTPNSRSDTAGTAADRQASSTRGSADIPPSDDAPR